MLLPLLLLAVLIFLLWNIRQWRTDLNRLAAIAREINEGKRPTSFIRNGPYVMMNVSNELESLCERLQSLQRQVSQEEFNLKAILSSMIEGVMVVDERMSIRLVNDAFLRLFSIHHSPLGQTPLELLRDSTLEKLLRETLKQQVIQSSEIRREAGIPGGEVRHFQVNALPLLKKPGTLSGAVVVFHEITRIKQLEEVRKEFVSNVSHELRTPLSIFQGYVETLIDQPDLPRDDQRRVFVTLKRHSDRLNALVRDLLTIARLESRRMTLHPESINLPQTLQRIQQDWSKHLSEKHLQLNLRLEQCPPTIHADPLRLEQVLNNLIDNAAKYSTPSQVITLQARQIDQHVHLEVQDQGIGIPPQDLPHIFERFYRVDKSRTRDQGGTGLGLSIVKHIVQVHGGTVTARSESGHGTTIEICLPLQS